MKNNNNNNNNSININELNQEIKSVEKRMGRLMENGDMKRLLKLAVRLDRINDMIAQLKQEEAARSAPKFRKSYGFENWCDSLAMGREKQTYL